MNTAYYTHRMLGQTNPAFSPGVDSSSADAATQTAGTNLLNYLDTNGVPPMTTPDPNVSVFQSAWNADPGNQGGNQQLSVDGEYGPNTHDALNALVGGIAPTVNNSNVPSGGGGGGTTPGINTNTTTTTTSTAAFFSGATPWLIGAAVVAGAALIYESSKHPMGKHARKAARGMHKHAHSLVGHRRGHARRK